MVIRIEREQLKLFITLKAYLQSAEEADYVAAKISYLLSKGMEIGDDYAESSHLRSEGYINKRMKLIVRAVLSSGVTYMMLS